MHQNEIFAHPLVLFRAQDKVKIRPCQKDHQTIWITKIIIQFECHVNSNTSAAANEIAGSESPVLRFLATRSGMPGPPRFERRGFLEQHVWSLPLEVPVNGKFYEMKRSGRHPAREQELHARSHMQERDIRSNNERSLGNILISRGRQYLAKGKRAYQEEYVDYNIGYAKWNEDSAHEWAKRNAKALRKVIAVLIIVPLIRR